MIIEKIKIENFNSFENATIDFTKHKNSILILGENQDNIGQDSNGSGKTSIVQAISFAIFGKIPKKTYVDDIVREGENQCCVKIKIRNKNEILLIERKRGKETSLRYWINESEAHPKSTYTYTQNALLEYLGVNPDNKDYYTDFLNTSYFSIDSLNTFASQSTSSEKKMALISRFLKLERIEKAKQNVKTKKDATKKECDIIKSNIDTINSMVSSIPKEELENEITKIETDVTKINDDIKKADIVIDQLKNKENVKTQIKNAESNINNLSIELKDFIELIVENYNTIEKKLNNLIELSDRKKEIEAEIQKIPNYSSLDTQINAIEAEIDICREKKSTLEGDFRVKNSEKTALTDSLEKALNCPECSAELMYDKQSGLEKFDTHPIKEKIRLTDIEIKKCNTKINKESAKITKLSDKLKKINDLNYMLKDLLREVEIINTSLNEETALKDKLTKLKETRETKTSEINNKIKTLKETKTTLENDVSLLIVGDINEIRSELSELQLTKERMMSTLTKNKTLISTLDENTKKINLLEDKLKLAEKDFIDYGIMENCFSTIRRWKIESFIPNFQDTANKYIEKLNCNYQILLNTMKEKRSSKKDEDKYKIDFNISVIDENGHERSIETFSNGENIRIILCLGLALREIAIQNSDTFFEFTMIDDMLGEVDESGGNNLVETLNCIEGQKLIISQNSHLKKLFKDIIIAVKKSGISTIKQEVLY